MPPNPLSPRLLLSISNAASLSPQKSHFAEAAMCYDQAHSQLMLIIQRTKHSEYAPYMTRLSSVSDKLLLSDLPLV